MKTIGILIVIFIVALIIVNASAKASESEIRDWAKEKGMEVKDIEMHVTAIGSPFYYAHKGSFIYEVDMTNGEKWWVRTSIFGNDYEKQI